MSRSDLDVARIRDLVWALVPTILISSAVLLIFLVRQVYGPARSEGLALVVLAVLPVMGAVLAGWESWRQSLHGLGLPSSGLLVRLAGSALAFSLVSLVAWGGPWLIVRRVVELASPFESMKWILTAGVILQGLAFRAVLSRRTVPAWMGILYWIGCAAAGIGLWKQVAGLFS